MKKISILVAALLLMFTLASCVTTNPTPSSSASMPLSTLDSIQQNGKLILGTAGTMPPLNMTTKTGQVIGMEIDIAERMAKAMDVELEVKTMPFADLLAALEAGQIDMVMSNMTMLPERNLKAAFVGPYYISGKAFLSKTETIVNATDLKNINRPDVTLAALNGSTSQKFVEQVLPETTLTKTRDYDEAVDLLVQDKVKAVVADFPICVVSVYRYPEAGLMTVATAFTYEPIGVALPRNDPAMVNWVENYFKNLKGSGQLEAISKKWFGKG